MDIEADAIGAGRFIAKPGWMKKVMSEGMATPPSSLGLPLHVSAFSELIPLLGHNALRKEVFPKAAPNLPSCLKEAFIVNDVARFVRDARQLAHDERIALRDCDVALRSGNLLTSRFLPPSAERLRKNLSLALKLIDSALFRARGSRGRSTVTAILAAQVLLTIHPFCDGNGRTARMFFAANVLRHAGPAPTALLGMFLMQRGGAHQYHQAAWAFRAGDVGPIIDLFIDAERQAREHFMPYMKARHLPASFLSECAGTLRALL